MNAFRATASICSITTSPSAIQPRHVFRVVVEDAVDVVAVELVVHVGVNLSFQRQVAKVWTE